MHNHHRSIGGHQPSRPAASTGYRYGHGGAGPGLYRGNVPIAPNAQPAPRRHRSSSMTRPATSGTARGASASSAASSENTAGGFLLFVVLMGVILIWGGIVDLFRAAHHHHESVFAFVLHAVAGWLA